MYCISFELEGLKQSVTKIYQKVTHIFFPVVQVYPTPKNISYLNQIGYFKSAISIVAAMRIQIVLNQ